jgi:hypothetical protein
VAYFKVLSHNLPGGNDKNYKYNRWLICGRSSKQLRSRNVWFVPEQLRQLEDKILRGDGLHRVMKLDGHPFSALGDETYGQTNYPIESIV